MYRHLLVPIDDTDLSIEVVGNAVGLARAVGARVTFFHAVTPQAGFSPGNPPPAATGKACELLAKAEAAARAFGVPCDSRHALSDQPAAAIVEVARAIGCDLVFMAAHAHHSARANGPAPASRTISGVLGAGLPVLVSRIGEPGPSAHAIGVIRDEHRSLAAVLHAWMQALAAARNAGAAADPRLMWDIVRYVETFAVALHDAKEERSLFGRLRLRAPSMNPELDEIERQHLRERERVADLARLVEALAAASGEWAANATRELDGAVRRYAASVWEHLGREEGVILPAAQRHLTDADWAEIDAVFMKSSDAHSGQAEELRHLFSRIVNGTWDEP